MNGLAAARHDKPGTLQLGGILTLGLVCVAMGSILVRFSQGAPSLTIALYRMGWASLFLFPFFVRRVVRAGFSIEWMHLCSGIALALHFAFWIASLRYTSVAVSVVLVNTSPVMVALLGYLFLGERLTRRGMFGLALSLLGSTVLVFHDLSELGDWRGPVLAIAGAAALGLYLVFGRRLRQGYDLLGYVYPTYVIAALTLLPVAVFSGGPLTGFSLQTNLSLALLGPGTPVPGTHCIQLGPALSAGHHRFNPDPGGTLSGDRFGLVDSG